MVKTQQLEQTLPSFYGGTALKMHLGGSERIAFTSSNSNPGKKSLPAYRRKPRLKLFQWAERL